MGFYSKTVYFLSRFTNSLWTRLYKVKKRLDYEKYLLEFGQRDDDIYITTFPKSGTTLTQSILYQLLTDGNMEFNHIYDVSPWIRNDSFEGIKPRKLKGRRIIKTHDNYKLFPPDFNGKIIYVYRNGMDVAVSQFHQRKNYGLSNLTFDNYLKSFFSPGPMNWFTFNLEWFKNKRKFDVLYLSYEEITKNKTTAIEKIIKFCDLDRNSIDINRVLERTDFKFMKEHQEKFGETPPKEETKVYDEFIRKGKAGEGDEYFNAQQKNFFENAYKRELKEIVDNNFNK